MAASSKQMVIGKTGATAEHLELARKRFPLAKSENELVKLILANWAEFDSEVNERLKRIEQKLDTIKQG